jgi:phosphatidate cytidylyltransferase
LTELTKRILFAVPAAAFFLYLTWLGGWIFTAVIIAMALLIQFEMSTICEKAGFKTDSYFPYSIALWILLIPSLPHAFEVGIAIFLLFVGVQVFNKSEKNIEEFVSTLFCGFYAPTGLLLFLLIRSLGSQEVGFSLTIALILMVWGNDVFAYFGGKRFGRRLMAPSISPKKTWEGFFSGFAGALTGLIIAVYLVPFAFPMNMSLALPLVALVSVFGPIGDLAESKLKRAAGVKDSSNILPGHGGFLDRFDALILAAPAFYLYIKLLIILDYVSF